MSKILNFNPPWVESDLFQFFLKFRPKKIKKIAKFFHDNGYVIVDLKLSKNYINETIKDIKKLAYDSNSKKNPKYYHYNENPRIIEGFKKSKFIKDLCHHKIIINLHSKIEGRIEFTDFNSMSISWIIISFFFELCDIGIKICFYQRKPLSLLIV